MNMRFGIALTYRCNLRCSECNRYLDRIGVPCSDVTLEGLQEGYDRVVAAGIQIDKTRVTGGEPLLHPRFVEAMRLIHETWNKDYGGRTPVFSNGTQLLPKSDAGWRYRVSSDGGRSGFRPTQLSPHDLGLKPILGVGEQCRIQKSCGRLFDAFGFSFCILGGQIGRLFGIDAYGPTPVVAGDPEVCKHCIWSQPRQVAWGLIRSFYNKGVEYPSPSYSRAFLDARWKGVKIKRFEER